MMKIKFTIKFPKFYIPKEKVFFFGEKRIQLLKRKRVLKILTLNIFFGHLNLHS